VVVGAGHTGTEVAAHGACSPTLSPVTTPVWPTIGRSGCSWMWPTGPCRAWPTRCRGPPRRSSAVEEWTCERVGVRSDPLVAELGLPFGRGTADRRRVPDRAGPSRRVCVW
jgi:hypothetical protein